MYVHIYFSASMKRVYYFRSSTLDNTVAVCYGITFPLASTRLRTQYIIGHITECIGVYLSSPITHYACTTHFIHPAGVTIG